MHLGHGVFGQWHADQAGAAWHGCLGLTRTQNVTSARCVTGRQPVDMAVLLGFGTVMWHTLDRAVPSLGQNEP